MGFRPTHWFYHDLSYKRESLACDMVELLRARIDYWVIQQFNQQVLRVDHFSVDESVNGGCTQQNRSGLFYAAYEYQAKHWRKILRQIARSWLKQLKPYFFVAIDNVENDDE